MTSLGTQKRSQTHSDRLLVQQLLGQAEAALAPGWKLLDVGWRDKRGSVAIMTAMLGVILIGFAALAVDVSIWEGNAATMQGAADQAALAASLAMSAGNAVAQKEAKGVAAVHGFLNGTGGVVVTVNIPPVAGSYVSNANAIEVVITQSQTMFLSGVLLKSPPVTSVRAVAVPAPATCILLLAPTGPGITSTGAVDVGAPTCNIAVNSVGACDVATIGLSSFTGFDISLGEQSQAGCTLGLSQIVATHKLQLGAAPALDPYSSRTIPRPSTSCQTVFNPLQLQIDLYPGTYCSVTLWGTQSLRLNPGPYIFDGGGLNALGINQITGTNVSLVFTSSGSTYGGISLAGASAMNLTPMTYGNTAGIAVWLDKAGAQSMTLAGVTSLNVTGAFYAPGSNISWLGVGNSPCTQLIAYSVSFIGAATFNHNCSNLGVADIGNAAGYKLSE